MPFPQATDFGYCTNVHAGVDLSTAKENLKKYASAVREQFCPHSRLPVGLWLSENAAASLLPDGAAEEFGQWLDDHGLSTYTLNGFPQKDFHADIVKHEVYKPTWANPSREEYTRNLAKVLNRILPPNVPGSISTLPLGWPTDKWNPEALAQSANHLKSVARFLASMLQDHGREIVLCIEPEPGCLLNTSDEIVAFFKEHLLGGEDDTMVRRHIGVCHDICHSGVMFESQEYALSLYQRWGIRVGKVQVSSAVHVPWAPELDEDENQAISKQLATFHEPKYLHQTSRSQDGKLVELAEDLSAALSSWLPESPEAATKNWPVDPWRVHFHVPIFVDQFDHLRTTRADILSATKFLENSRDVQVDSAPWFLGHYEVETYAWPVLPSSLSTDDLAEGIAQELSFFGSVLQRVQD